MASNNSKSNFTSQLKCLISEQKDREQHHEKSVMKMNVWNMTVKMSLFLKRFFDIVLSVMALIVLMPLFIVLAILIKLDSRGPVFFVQDRVGRYGLHFRFYKFRSMYQGAELKKAELMSQNQSKDGVIFKMKRDPRITRVGRVIRKTSIDELPQFFNVLFGDMSLVGPRPPLPSEVQKYTLEDRKRLNIKPGLTCLWQIKGRSDIPFKEQVRLDKEYIQSQSLRQDLLILLRTIPAIISGRGAY